MVTRFDSNEQFLPLTDWKDPILGRSSVPTIRFVADDALEITVADELVIVPLQRICRAVIRDDMSPPPGLDTPQIVQEALWANMAQGRRVAIEVDPPLLLHGELGWRYKSSGRAVSVPVRALYISMDAPDEFIKELDERRRTARRSRTHLTSIGPSDVTAAALESLAINAIMGGPDSVYPDIFVAHKVVSGQLVYRFAIREELTDDQWHELTSEDGSVTKCFLLKHIVLEMLGGLERRNLMDRPVVAGDLITGQRVYDDGQFVVLDHSPQTRRLNPALGEDYELFEKLNGQIASVESNYAKVWQLAQAIAARYHLEQ